MQVLYKLSAVTFTVWPQHQTGIQVTKSYVKVLIQQQQQQQQCIYLKKYKVYNTLCPAIVIAMFLLLEIIHLAPAHN